MSDKNNHRPERFSDDENAGGRFDLGGFFPYLVRIYYRAVSEAISGVYTKSHGLSVSEWRTMAVLGAYSAMSASEIVERSSMDKVNVSRAVKGLLVHGFMTRDIDGEDRRRSVLRLTEEGRKVFNDLVPRVKEMESTCLKGLSQSETATLISLMERVRLNAESHSPETN